MFSVFLCQAGLLRGEVPVLPQRKADVGSSPTLHWTGNTVTINTLNSSSINLLHFPSYLSLVRSRSCSVVLGSDDAIWNYIMSLLVWKNKTSNVRTQCLFLATVPEADVCSGSGSWCLGKPIWTDPRSVWGSGGLLLWTLPGNNITSTTDAHISSISKHLERSVHSVEIQTLSHKLWLWPIT